MSASQPPVDAYEGLPAHMVESVPHTAEVTVHQEQCIMVGGEEKIVLDSKPQVHIVQLERDGVPLTKGGIGDCWAAGERDGWLARPFA